MENGIIIEYVNRPLIRIINPPNKVKRNVPFIKLGNQKSPNIFKESLNWDSFGCAKIKPKSWKKWKKKRKSWDRN